VEGHPILTECPSIGLRVERDFQQSGRSNNFRPGRPIVERARKKGVTTEGGAKRGLLESATSRIDISNPTSLGRQREEGKRESCSWLLRCWGARERLSFCRLLAWWKRKAKDAAGSELGNGCRSLTVGNGPAKKAPNP